MARANGIGARVPRKEDDRFLAGRGIYIGDISLDGMREVAFLRSPVAHARLRGVEIPAPLRSSVFTADDLTTWKRKMADMSGVRYGGLS